MLPPMLFFPSRHGMPAVASQVPDLEPLLVCLMWCPSLVRCCPAVDKDVWDLGVARLVEASCCPQLLPRTCLPYSCRGWICQVVPAGQDPLPCLDCLLATGTYCGPTATHTCALLPHC